MTAHHDFTAHRPPSGAIVMSAGEADAATIEKRRESLVLPEDLEELLGALMRAAITTAPTADLESMRWDLNRIGLYEVPNDLQATIMIAKKLLARAVAEHRRADEAEVMCLALHSSVHATEGCGIDYHEDEMPDNWDEKLAAMQERQK